ncbi:unnamed protein product [Adineta ricciae]|uniref:Tetratricopeptide repeat protein n=1 Tax=Adineta ricciae TaxID=249248 RepID=A0A814K189_ADIRI|nr:unnamed protein product [Adineta ricciae]
MGSCYSANKSLRATFIENENLEVFSLIWLDNVDKKSQKSNSIQRRLRATINYLKVFINETECERYIKQMPQDENIVLVINDQIGQMFISNIHDLPQLFSIYIYSPSKNIDQSWINQFNKIKSICVDYNELTNQIKVDQRRYMLSKDELLFDIFHINQPSNGNKRFLYSQILIDVLLETDPASNDAADLLSLCRQQYKGNKVELDLLRKFDESYSSENAISWLIQDTFISQIFNKALRRENLDLMFLFRFFLQDIHQELTQSQHVYSIKVYRHQQISDTQLELLKNSVGQFISINNFLVANMDRQSALSFEKVSVTTNSIHSILFEITANPHLNKSKPFAVIDKQDDAHQDSNEVLFMLGSIFQLNSIRQDENNTWIIEMTLSDKTNKYLKSVYNNYKNEDGDINLLSLGYILQELNKSDEAEKYYRRLITEFSDDDERIGYCCLNLGNIAFIKKNYEASYELLSKALQISIQTLEPDDMFFAQIYNSIGHLHHAKQESKLAIESYKNAISIWKQSIDENYFNIAECKNNLGIIYKEEHDYEKALECFQMILVILEKYLSHDHLDLSKTHCNIASIYRQLEEYEAALQHYNAALDILQKHYPTKSSELAKVMGNIGIIFALKDDRQKALSYYEKTAEVYREILPPTHINNIKIDQLIQNASVLPRELSFVVVEPGQST